MLANVFPDISPDYAKQISSEHSGDSGLAINAIMDDLEERKPYPKKPVASLKRKRERMTDEADPRMTELKRKYSYTFLRNKTQSEKDVALVEQVLCRHFIFLQKDIITQTMHHFDNLLLPTYLDLEEKLRNWSAYSPKPWPDLADNIPEDSTKYITSLVWDTNSIRPTVLNCKGDVDPALYQELLAAIRIRNSRIKKVELEKIKEKQLDQEAMDKGFAGECGCCYVDFPIHRMVQCDGQREHMFCLQCARRNAEAQIGLSRWELQCMSTDGCSGGFSHGERSRFLDPKLMEALDRIEADSVVNLAGITLAKCPFCSFAAEYPPIDQDREFRCGSEACMEISCRLCGEKSHIPKTCDEARTDSNRSARLIIEEAMSVAMIRTCNKCKSPFIKDFGCNKMTCPVTTCRNMQCYICSKDCDYNHFVQKHVRPEDSQCPLYDNSEDRHEKEVKEAQDKITREVKSERPDIAQENLEINMSDRVREDEERRRRANYSQVPRPQRAPGAELARWIRDGHRVANQLGQPILPANEMFPIIPAHGVGGQEAPTLVGPRVAPVAQPILGVQPLEPAQLAAAALVMPQPPPNGPGLATGAVEVAAGADATERLDEDLGLVNGFLRALRPRHRLIPVQPVGDGDEQDGGEAPRVDTRPAILPFSAAVWKLAAHKQQLPGFINGAKLLAKQAAPATPTPKRNDTAAKLPSHNGVIEDRVGRLRARATRAQPAQKTQSQKPGQAGGVRERAADAKGAKRGGGTEASSQGRHARRLNFDINTHEWRDYGEKAQGTIANHYLPESHRLPGTNMQPAAKANSATLPRKPKRQPT